jgi:pyruvate/2-oxoglutarate dehydrogenase complex dihydrolipoamide acyltransferase (E2) component
MVFEIRMPDFGQGISGGSVLEWKKEMGDNVQMGEPLCEIEAEKTVQDLLSTGDGILRIILGEEGAELPSGTLLAIVADVGDDISGYQQ